MGDGLVQVLRAVAHGADQALLVVPHAQEVVEQTVANVGVKGSYSHYEELDSPILANVAEELAHQQNYLRHHVQLLLLPGLLEAVAFLAG